MINPKNFELADTAPFDETVQACIALDAAIEAMAHHGSDPQDINVIATLYAVMHQEKAAAQRVSEALRQSLKGDGTLSADSQGKSPAGQRAPSDEGTLA